MVDKKGMAIFLYDQYSSPSKVKGELVDLSGETPSKMIPQKTRAK